MPKRGEQAKDQLVSQIVQGNCIVEMGRIPDASVALVCTDPPYNYGINYGDHFDDDRPTTVYLDWARLWLAQIYRVLSDTGSFWLFMPDELVSEIDVICKSDGHFHKRSHVIWTYTFGVNCTNKLTRSHVHLLYYTVNLTKFIFNADQVRVPSARQLIYNDKRANPDGRLPDDTWIIRPQDFNGFLSGEDTWHCPRINGTFKSRLSPPTQLPEQLVGRILRACSNPGDLVLDPFCGSGTTLAVARKLGRRFLGFELSEDYCRLANERVAGVKEGDMLDPPCIQGG
jgi:DNA modification methylase